MPARGDVLDDVLGDVLGDAADDVVAAFRALAGGDPAGVWSAPGRVNLIGEHTDYNDGHVLPFAIGARTRAAVRLRDDGRVRLASTAYDGSVETNIDDLQNGRGWPAYVLGTVWALRAAGADIRGLDVAVDSALPSGGGLSSSAALESSVALALAELTGSALSRLELAQAGQRAENEVVGAPVGLMDQAAVLLAEPDVALLFDCRTFEWEHVPLDPAAAGLRLLLTDTRVAHDLADGQYAARRADCEQAARTLGVAALRDVSPDRLAEAEAERDGRLDPRLLRRARHVVSEQQRVGEAVEALRGGSWDVLGRLLTASHASLRDDYEVSVAELDGAVEAALAAGALGARVTGGGFGGNTVALVPETLVDGVAAAVRARAERGGWPVPRSTVVRPAAGAARDR